MSASGVLAYTQLGNGDFGMMTLRMAHPEEVRCICFPFSGGSPLAFRDLAASLPSTWTVIAIDPPGRCPTRPVRPYRVEELAEYYVDELPRRLLDGALLVGHSLGGYVALELAACLERKALPPRGLVVSGVRPPHLADPSRPLSRLSDDALFRWLADLGGIPGPPQEQRELFDLFCHIIRADIDAFESYCHARTHLDRTPLLALGAGGDQLCSRAQLDEWRPYARRVEIKALREGEHLFVLSHPQAMAREIIAFLAPAAPERS